MGILQKLFGRNGKKRSKIKISIEELENSANIGNNRKFAEEKILNNPLDIEKLVENDLDAEAVDVWKCLVCDFENTVNFTICASCKNKAGKWKCPLCGRIQRADFNKCACKFNWETWIQCHKCKQWYNGIYPVKYILI
jgi:rubrerythrin